MEFQLSYFKSSKCCIQYARKFGNFSNVHRTGKGQFSLQSQRKAMPKNVQSIVQFSSVTQLCPTLCDPIDCSMPGFLVHHQFPELLKLMPIESVMPSNRLILCRPFSSCLQSFPASGSLLMSALCIRWPKYWSFSFSVSPSSECSGLISFRMDWVDLPAVQGTLRSLLQHHSSKASVLQCSAFFMIQL